ncbi:MAG TPA: hypothetical protein VN896_13510 [Methylomirabilota bacterium]|nr:hypothetical protein [Methylomirabilota bacterium]
MSKPPAPRTTLVATFQVLTRPCKCRVMVVHLPGDTTVLDPGTT